MAWHGPVAYHVQFVRFTESLEKVGDHLRKAEDSYRTAKNQLTEGRGNLVRRTEQIRQLGAKTRKSIAPDLLERAEAEAEANSAADDAANGLSRVEPGSAD